MSPEPVTPVEGRRERKKRETRQALEDAAWRLFTRKGYDATTITDITESVDVAPRTFFRYFDSKEAVLFGDWRANVDDLGRRVRDRPTDEAPLDALANAVLSLSEQFETERAIAFQRARIAATSHHVGRFQRQIIQPAWEEVLTAAVAERLGVEPDIDLRPRLYAGTAVAVLLAAVATWLHRQDHHDDLPDLVRAGFGELTSTSERSP